MMRKLLLAMMLSTVATTASAAWTMVGDGDDDELVAYVDVATIRRNKNLVKMVDLLDFKKVETVAGVTYLSIKTQSEYDCKEDRSRDLAGTWYSGQMGSGAVVYLTGDATKWRPVSPDSIDETRLKIACGK